MEDTDLESSAGITKASATAPPFSRGASPPTEGGEMHLQWAAWALPDRVSSKRPGSLVNRGLLLAVFVGFGADKSFIDRGLAKQLQLRLEPLMCPLVANALDGHLLWHSPDSPSDFLDLSRVPSIYLDLEEGLLYSLSAPEMEAMKQYIQYSLVTCIIHPSSSPAGTGFFFVDKKDKTLQPCIDSQGLNDITIKNREKCNTAAAAKERETAWENIAAQVNACCTNTDVNLLGTDPELLVCDVKPYKLVWSNNQGIPLVSKKTLKREFNFNQVE
eukprot:superscaffoldBa00000104_g1511